MSFPFLTMDADMQLLFKAVSMNIIEAVQTLLKKSIDLNYINCHGDNVLNIAVAKNQKEMVKFLVMHGARLNDKRTKISPLILAIKHDFRQMVRVLVDSGANVEEGWIDDQQILPLLFAVGISNYNMVKVLIQKGANVNGTHLPTKITPLHEVGILNLDHPELNNTTMRLKIAKLLLQHKANLAAIDIFYTAPLDRAVQHSAELSKLFIKEGAEVRRKSDLGSESFFEIIMPATGLNDPELIRLCLERGSDYHQLGFIDNSFTSPYHCALKISTPEVVKVFWEFGCQVDLPPATPQCNMPVIPIELCSTQVNGVNNNIYQAQLNLMKGINQNDLNMVLTAIENGAEPKGTARDIPSTLHYIASTSKGNHKIAQVLLEHGVPVNKLDCSVKKTCLFFALLNNNLNVTKEVLKFGVCFTKQDLNTLKSVKNKEIHKIMDQVTKAFNFTRIGSPMVVKKIKKFIKNGNKDMAKMLMNCVDWHGHSLLALALSKKHVNLAEDLMKLRIKHF